MAFGEERENFVYIAKLAEQAERYDGLSLFFEKKKKNSVDRIICLVAEKPLLHLYIFSCIFSAAELVF
jgi:hypothetical protein